MGLFRRAVFHHGRLPENSPISVKGPCPLINGPFSTLNGPFHRMPQLPVFPLGSRPENRLLGKSGTKIQPKEEVFSRISLRTSGQKLRSGPPNPGKASILERTSRADVHEKNFGLKNFGLIFQTPPSYGFGTLRFWIFRAPGLPSARQVLCGDAPRLFFYHFSVHLSSVPVSWGGQSSVMRSGLPGPKNPKSSTIKTTTFGTVRFSFRGNMFNIRQNHPLGNHPFAVETQTGYLLIGF